MAESQFHTSQAQSQRRAEINTLRHTYHIEDMRESKENELAKVLLLKIILRFLFQALSCVYKELIFVNNNIRYT